MVVEHPPIDHPPVPAPVKIQTIRYERCGDRLCVTVAQAKADIRNKIKVSGWMFEANSALIYYRQLGSPAIKSLVKK